MKRRRCLATEKESQFGITDNIKIDLSSIPDHVREDLAAATYEAVRNFLAQPGGKEMLDAEIAARKARYID